MTEAIWSWWRKNGGIILATLIGGMTGAGFAGIVWGVTLANRVVTIEERGSPQVDKIEKRLTRVEERQINVMDTLKTNGLKLDAIGDELRRHEIENSKR